MSASDDPASASPVPRGARVPDVALPATTGVEVRLADAGPAVVYVYTWTGSPGLDNPRGWDDIPGAHGSTPESRAFRDLHDRFVAAGRAVYGLSTQTPAYQRDFALREGLPFALLSDADGRFGAALGLPVFETGGVVYYRRLTLLIADGEVERCLYPVDDPAGHPAEVLAELERSPR